MKTAISGKLHGSWPKIRGQKVKRIRTSPLLKEAQLMRAVAIKKGQSREKAEGFHEMGALRCDLCGEEFVISHEPGFADEPVADKQARWLERVLAEEHERDKKHADRIELPY
jgi:hypothetical protein